MVRLLRIVGVAAVAGSVLAGTALAEMEYENRVKTMKMQGANLGAIGKVAKGEAPYSPALVGNAEALLQLSNSLAVLFPEGSGGGKSRAKPEIWTDWAGVEKQIADLQAAEEALLAAVKTGDVAKIGPAVGAVGKVCGSCHDAYRGPKKE